MKVDVFDVTRATRDLLCCSVTIELSDSKVPSLVRNRQFTTVNKAEEEKHRKTPNTGKGAKGSILKNPLTHDIKEQILLSCPHTFLIKVPGRSY